MPEIGCSPGTPNSLKNTDPIFAVGTKEGLFLVMASVGREHVCPIEMDPSHLLQTNMYTHKPLQPFEPLQNETDIISPFLKTVMYSEELGDMRKKPRTYTIAHRGCSNTPWG